MWFVPLLSAWNYASNDIIKMCQNFENFGQLRCHPPTTLCLSSSMPHALQLMPLVLSALSLIPLSSCSALFGKDGRRCQEGALPKTICQKKISQIPDKRNYSPTAASVTLLPRNAAASIMLHPVLGIVRQFLGTIQWTPECLLRFYKAYLVFIVWFGFSGEGWRCEPDAHLQ